MDAHAADRVKPWKWMWWLNVHEYNLGSIPRNLFFEIFLKLDAAFFIRLHWSICPEVLKRMHRIAYVCVYQSIYVCIVYVYSICLWTEYITECVNANILNARVKSKIYALSDFGFTVWCSKSISNETKKN